MLLVTHTPAIVVLALGFTLSSWWACFFISWLKMFSLQELHSPCKIKFWWTDILNKYDKNFRYQLFLLKIKVNSNKHSNFDWLFFHRCYFYPQIGLCPFHFSWHFSLPCSFSPSQLINALHICLHYKKFSAYGRAEK